MEGPYKSQIGVYSGNLRKVGYGSSRQGLEKFLGVELRRGFAGFWIGGVLGHGFFGGGGFGEGCGAVLGHGASGLGLWLWLRVHVRVL